METVRRGVAHVALIVGFCVAAMAAADAPPPQCTAPFANLSAVPPAVVTGRLDGIDPHQPELTVSLSLCEAVVWNASNPCREHGEVFFPGHLSVYNATREAGGDGAACEVMFGVFLEWKQDLAGHHAMRFLGVGWQPWSINDTWYADVFLTCGPSLALVPNRSAFAVSRDVAAERSTLTLWFATSAACGDPSTTTTTPAPTPTAAPNATTAPPPPPPVPVPTHPLMSHIGFAVLVVMVFAAYYGALLVTSLAVGESTNTLMMPLRMIKTLALSAYDCVCFAIGRKQPVGYSGLDFEDDDDFPNHPVASATADIG